MEVGVNISSAFENCGYARFISGVVFKSLNNSHFSFG